MTEPVHELALYAVPLTGNVMVEVGGVVSPLQPAKKSQFGPLLLVLVLLSAWIVAVPA